ncbi:DUF2130 domain-containing protein [Candidatus Tokpelaia sp.]|uniref:DUF2130 domain-containing protein n=1 Tax=Candidatus Tokpelaia sp. TaxID=2233777 RepID=UPI00123B56B6|nr:DUF2130 domain-containing protein [Candidatus Tokpelaia sp.]KAA6406338.1 DUF2130 domain-containing protein [Candidatus Tokpelaia sp.]
MPDSQIIICPKCGTEISVNEILRNQIAAEIGRRYEVEKAKDKSALEAEKSALEKEREKLAFLKEESERAIANQVKTKLAESEKSLRRQLKQEAETEQKQITDLLKEQLADRDSKLQNAAKQEIEFLKQKAVLEEKQRNLEIETLKRLETEKEKIRKEAELKALESSRLIIAQKDKLLAESQQTNAEMARKLQQGSQQAQGEALELTLEDALMRAFDRDTIAPVPKGIRGADIVQTVYNAAGKECGHIIWEAKNTKNWSDGWIAKLKEDQRALGADIAILVSTILPEGITGFAWRDGIWVCDRRFAIPLAIILRDKLEAIAREKNLAVGKNEKMEVLYQYLTGTQFRQRIEAIIENFSAMQDDLAKEKRSYQKKWATAEKRLETVLRNTISMYGDLDAMVTLPKIPALELEFDDKDEVEHD